MDHSSCHCPSVHRPYASSHSRCGASLPLQVPPSSYACIETVLSIGQHHGLLEPNAAGDDLMSLLVHNSHSTEVLANFGFYFRAVLEFNAGYIDRGEQPPPTHMRSRTPDAMMAGILRYM